ncbi:MAG: DNA-binding NarL/FixJ family response regulator [Limisphaerales bacterium]|jgi:DNA-binding NarL/FixJ family response regulator
MRLFITEDKMIARLGLSGLVEDEADIEIVGTAVNGKEFLEKISDLEVDVVFMDIEMPVINGIEATRSIKAIRPEIKVIMVTDYDEAPLLKQAKSAGAEGYMLKNIDKGKLLTALSRVMEGGTYYQPEEDDPSKAAKRSNLPLPDISHREKEVIELLAEGFNSNEIAEKLFISKNTVDTHRKNMLNKTGSKNVAELIGWAAKRGLI